MAHFAKIGKGNIVEKVVVVHNNIATTEQAGIQFLKDLYNEPYSVWIQTSYNTRGGVHKTGGTPFRMNYAGVGYKYDDVRDVFIPPKPFDSWTLNENTLLWNPPVSFPDDGNRYKWNETIKNWELITKE
jgi:hypothetical protein